MAIGHILSALFIFSISLVTSIAFLATESSNNDTTRYFYIAWVTVSAAFVWIFLCSALVLWLRERKLQNKLEKGMEWQKPNYGPTIRDVCFPNGSQGSFHSYHRTLLITGNMVPPPAPAHTSKPLPRHPPMRFSPVPITATPPTPAPTPPPKATLPYNPLRSHPPTQAIRGPVSNFDTLKAPLPTHLSPILDRSHSISPFSDISSLSAAKIETASQMTLSVIAPKTPRTVYVKTPKVSYATPQSGGFGGEIVPAKLAGPPIAVY